MSLHIVKIRKSTNSGITSSSTALSANEARQSYYIQNLGTNPLFVKEGEGASTTNFTFILAAGSGNDNGTGGAKESKADEVWTGAISIAGTSPRYTITERTESL